MDRRGALVLTAALFLAGPCLAQGFDYDRFRSKTLFEAQAVFLGTQAASDLPEKVGDIRFNETPWRWRATATYTGRQRPMEADELAFVRNWVKSFGREDAASLFTNAYLFTAEGLDYWLPVEGPVAGFFPKELKPGDQIDLFVVDPGGFRRKDGWEWLPLVEEYRKLD